MDNLSTNSTFDFMHAINTLPEESKQIEDGINNALRTALAFENELKKHLVDNKKADPYINLIDVFDTPSRFRQSRPRTIIFEDFDAHHLFPLSYKDRRNQGSPSCVSDLAAFKTNWHLFSHGVLEQFTDWDNVIVAGGSVLAALVRTHAITNKELLEYYHGNAYASADIDLFLWGIASSEAEDKICSIFAAVKASVPWDVVAVRKANVISIHTQFPHRHVQIILRLYQSPAEILIGFDVDCCSVCFDGKHVWATPRAMASIISQRLTVDMSRRSPSYEMRLAKYAQRGWEIFYPNLRRASINPELYDTELRTIPTGLGRLLVLEKLFFEPDHYMFIKLQGTSLFKSQNMGNHHKFVEIDAGGLDSNYDYKPYQLPYALEWNADKVKRFSKRLEKRLSSKYNDINAVNEDVHPHRHVMIACDDVRDCFADFCVACPLPKEPQQKNDQRRYIHGRIQFMTTNPGQQRVISGSFHPISDDDWEEDAYDSYSTASET